MASVLFPPLSTIVSMRSRCCQAIRQNLIACGCDEVSTPILCPRPDIAPVRQFVTAHPHRGDVACLRIAPTEYLKRLLAGGVERVFEFSVNFRADAADSTHLPEFESLEVMACGVSCQDMQDWTERICKVGISAVRGGSLAGGYQPAGCSIAFRLDCTWSRVSVRQLFADAYGFGADDLFNDNAIRELFERVFVNSSATDKADAIDQMLARACLSKREPTFICDFPNYLGGPAKPCSPDSRFKERSELFVGALELANMSSTLVEPIAVRAWHEAGIRAKESLGIQPNEVDTALLAAVDRGIPPSAVLGIGIDRLLMVALGLHEVAAVRPFSYGTQF